MFDFKDIYIYRAVLATKCPI